MRSSGKMIFELKRRWNIAYNNLIKFILLQPCPLEMLNIVMAPELLRSEEANPNPPLQIAVSD